MSDKDIDFLRPRGKFVGVTVTEDEQPLAAAEIQGEDIVAAASSGAAAVQGIQATEVVVGLLGTATRATRQTDLRPSLVPKSPVPAPPAQEAPAPAPGLSAPPGPGPQATGPSAPPALGPPAPGPSALSASGPSAPPAIETPAPGPLAPPAPGPSAPPAPGPSAPPALTSVQHMQAILDLEGFKVVSPINSSAPARINLAIQAIEEAVARTATEVATDEQDAAEKKQEEEDAQEERDFEDIFNSGAQEGAAFRTHPLDVPGHEGKLSLAVRLAFEGLTQRAEPSRIARCMGVLKSGTRIKDEDIDDGNKNVYTQQDMILALVQTPVGVTAAVLICESFDLPESENRANVKVDEFRAKKTRVCEQILKLKPIEILGGERAVLHDRIRPWWRVLGILDTVCEGNLPKELCSSD